MKALVSQSSAMRLVWHAQTIIESLEYPNVRKKNQSGELLTGLLVRKSATESYWCLTRIAL